MGFVPNEAEIGGVVVVFLGAKVSFLLCKYEGEDRYFLVGECYIYGITEGEVIEQTNKKLWNLDGFTIL